MKKITSFFVPYAYGIAADNLVSGSDILEVYPEELLPTFGGEVTPDTILVETKGVDQEGNVYQTSMKAGLTFECKWLKGGRSILPDNVRRGERIVIYRQGDSDKYYWRSAGMDQNLRRLETIILCVSANPDNDDQDEPSPDNSYFLEISTHSKVITLSTSMMNGEQAAFYLQIDTGEGTIRFTDEKGNKTFFDSVNTFFEMLNVDLTRFTVNKKIIDVFAEESITFTTKDFFIEAGNSIQFNAGEFFKLTTKATTIESSDTVDIKTTTFTTEASSAFNVKTNIFNVEAGGTATIKSPMITLDGMVQTTAAVVAAGPLTAAALAVAGGAGSMTGGGALTVSAATINGATTMAGPLTVASVTSQGPMTAGGRPVLTA